MTTKVKERVITILINSFVTLGAIFLAFKLNSGFAMELEESKDAKSLEKKIEGKVGKEEFSEYKEGQTKKWDDHGLKHQNDIFYFDKIMETIEDKFDEQLDALDKRFDDFKEFTKN